MSSQPLKNPDLEALASEDQAALKETKMEAIALEIGCAVDRISNTKDAGGFRFFTDDLGRSWSVKIGKSGRVVKNSLRRDYI